MTSAAEQHVFVRRDHTYCRAAIALDKLAKRRYQTYQFPLTEHRAAPRRCLSGPAIEALATNAVAEFHPRIISKDCTVSHEPGKRIVERIVLGLNKLGWWMGMA